MAAVPKSCLSFTDLRKGMRVRIIDAHIDCDDCLRLSELGLTRGTVFSVVKVAPLGDPVEIDVRGYRLCLRRKEAHCFKLEIAD